MAETRKIFFSYARSDSEFAVRLANDLRNEGQDIWVDQLDIPKGARWDEAVESALEACPCLLVVLTPDSASSENVRDEVSYALGENKSIIPILFKQCSIPFRLRRLQYVDFTGDYDQGIRELRDALSRLESPAELQTGVRDAARRETAASAKPLRSRPEAHTSDGGTAERVEGVQRAGSRAMPWKVLAPASLAILAIIAGAYLVLSPDSDNIRREPSTPVAPAPIDTPQPEAPRAAGPSVSDEGKATAPAVSMVAPPPPAEIPRPERPGITDDQAVEFVHRFLATVNRSNPSELLAFYAGRVDYFDRGIVGKDYILRDKQAYYRRWPEVRNKLQDKVLLEQTDREDTVTLSFRIAWEVYSPERREARTGTAHNELQVRRIGDELKITAERQRVSRN